MKLEAIALDNYPPIRQFEVHGLSNIVVLAGPNGVGKSRVLNRLLEAFRNPSGQSHVRLVITATSEEERAQWGATQLDTSNPGDAGKLSATLHRQQRRGNWRSNAVYFDSTRQFSQIKDLQWSWQLSDPMDELLGWDYLYQPFLSRYQDTIHAIYRILGHFRSNIAKSALELQRSGAREMPLDFPDPLSSFKEAFNLLLAPKQLAEIDIASPKLEYLHEETCLPIDTLSSGEKEVLSTTFDLLLRNPQDCIIFFDEPELHLHPELSFRLLKTLQTIGARNQFLFCTHSADIIGCALDHSVVFLSPRRGDRNQGILLQRGDENVLALRELGQSLGVISLGRKIVLIEGQERSLDRDVYGSIIQGRFPGLVLAPSGSRQTILSFAKVVEDVLNRTIWGIEFFMLADRDNSLPSGELQRLEGASSGRLRFLPRYHVENYFLDETTIAESFADLVSPGNWQRDPEQIRAALLDSARSLLPLAVNLRIGAQMRSLVGEIEVAAKDVQRLDLATLKKKLGERVTDEAARVNDHLAASTVERLAEESWRELEKALADGDAWKRVFPGKILLGALCARAGLSRGHFQTLFINVDRRNGHRAFAEVIEIFAGFEKLAAVGER